MKFKVFTLFLLYFTSLYTQAQDKYLLKSIAFYNIENLFDTIDDPNINDEDFLPNAAKQWGTERYNKKLKNMAQVISEIGVNPSLGVTEPPIILGLSEIENRQVVQDLINTQPLRQENYGICHFDSPDARGVDVALIYKKSYFKPVAEQSRRLNYPKEPDFKTRDQLVVTGLFEGDTISIIVNHWPSRRGGEKRSEPLRVAAAGLTRSIVDSLLDINPNAKIVVMGDLNDAPNNNSVFKTLKAKGDISELKKGEMFNPMYPLHKKGYGTLAHNDIWAIFDQIIMSQGMLNIKNTGYNYFNNTARIYDAKYLANSSGKFEGYPFRTYVGDTFQGGYSDHFPVFIYVAKKVD